VIIPSLPPALPPQLISSSDDPERANSVKERMKRFSSLSNTPKCATCERSVYANDPQVVLDGLSYHRACAKCMECKCQITIQNFTKSGTTLYCKTHYIKKFKEEGTILGSEKFTHQSAPGKFAGSGFTIQRSDSSVAAAPAEPAAAAPAPEPIQKPSTEPAPEAVPEPVQEPVAVPAAAPEPTPEPEVVSESDVKLEESNTEEVVEAPVEAETPSEPATAPADEEEEKAEAPVATETEEQEQSDAKAESAEQETPAVDVDVPAASPAGQEGEEESEGV
jgi:hypothetical protein